MSYPRGLDEYDDAELQSELSRRAAARAKGRCDYCGRVLKSAACRYPHRHVKATPTARTQEADADE